ncbi:hypothetical protein MKX01_011817 [Papaver californicum]|nr:hypothetical protein MKX01_011817 [Papaver californicum]
MGVGKDRLSDLYDPLLHHIFAFLAFKCVVATCILSKRWKDLWIFYPVLNIHEWRRQSRSWFIETRDENTLRDDLHWSLETTGLVNFLDRLLHQSHPLFRNDFPAIKKFCLDYDSNFANDRISGWIFSLMMRKIEELSLCILTEFVIGTLRAAETISFPRLKIMIFVDESLNAQLFSNSLVLEELMLSNCYMMKTKSLNISVASLKRFFITNSKIFSCNLKIYALNLQTLTYNGMAEGYANTEQVFSSIVDAYIYVTFESRTNKNSKRRRGLKNLVEGISNVKILHISGSTLELSESMSFALLNLLHKVPNLESVVIAQASRSPLSNTFRRRECLLPQLKAVEVREIDGKQEDLDMIKYFLRSSPALQILTIAFPSSLQQYWRGRVRCFQKSLYVV